MRKVVPIHFSHDQYQQIEGYRAEVNMQAFSAAVKELAFIGLEVVRGGRHLSRMDGYVDLSEKLSIESLMILRHLARELKPEALEHAQAAAKRYYDNYKEGAKG